MAANAAPAGENFLERFFKLRELGTTIQTEIIAGLTTFMVMSYIIAVNPATLTFNGELGVTQVATVTCLVAGVMSIIMGLYTNRAIGIAPGLGINAIVAYTLVGSMGLSFPEAMGVVFTEGVVITLLVLTGIRKYVLEMVPSILKKAISVGIGFFILLLGLTNAGVITYHSGDFTAESGTYTGRLDLTPLNTWPILVSMVGLIVIIVLMARNVKAAIFWGIIAATVAAFVVPGNVTSMPSEPFKGPDFSLVGDISFGYWGKLGVLTSVLVVISIMLSDFFDTMGTLIGVGSQAGYLDENGDFPDAEKPLLVDSVAAAAGGFVSASSATSYIESTAGVSVGGRSGLVVVVTGLLFLLALPFVALVEAIPGAATAPALIVVGLLMMSVLAEDEGVDRHGQKRGIDFSNMEDSFPVALTMLVMPFTFNITYGIGAGFVSYVLIKVARGKAAQVNPAMWAIAGLFLLYFLRWTLFGAEF
ncbi:MAG TPA: NCS2 family permease [Thermomicrobiales bacterium]|nr:NCS2 family permease [Thermomicrobiales bacterium]